MISKGAKLQRFSTNNNNNNPCIFRSTPEGGNPRGDTHCTEDVKQGLRTNIVQTEDSIL